MKRNIAPRHSTTRRMRLKGFDYRTPGYYFITICQKDRLRLFSHIDEGGSNHLSPSGQMLASTTLGITRQFPTVKIDAFVIMPNHVHILLGMNLAESTKEPESVIDVIHWWKTKTTNQYGWGVRSDDWPRYAGSLWQEGYHDRIVRDQRELEYIRYYIEQNPARWGQDTFFDDDLG